MTTQLTKDDISVLLEAISDVFHVNDDYAKLFDDHEKVDIQKTIEILLKIKEGKDGEFGLSHLANLNKPLLIKVLLVLLKTHLKKDLEWGAHLETYVGCHLGPLLDLLIKLNGDRK